VKRVKVTFDTGSVPPVIRQYIEHAAFYDSSCSEQARTLLAEGADRLFLKMGMRGRLEREYRMTQFLHRHSLAPRPIAYASDADRDYFLTEAAPGEDGTFGAYLEQPVKLAGIFGEALRMLHSLPTEECPYPGRTSEMIKEQGGGRKIGAGLVRSLTELAVDDVVIHGDYCLPNIILDNFAFQAFVDTGDGGVGDRHYDLYWGIWTLAYNLKTDRYGECFLDAYGRSDIDSERLLYFTRFAELAD